MIRCSRTSTSTSTGAGDRIGRYPVDRRRCDRHSGLGEQVSDPEDGGGKQDCSQGDDDGNLDEAQEQPCASPPQPIGQRRNGDPLFVKRSLDRNFGAGFGTASREVQRSASSRLYRRVGTPTGRHGFWRRNHPGTDFLRCGGQRALSPSGLYFHSGCRGKI